MTKKFKIEDYSVFVKMIASENITLSVGKNTELSAPYFNLKDRVLHVPKWPNLEKPVLRMVLAHESAHAIYTSYKKITNEIDKFTKDYNLDLKSKDEDVVREAQYKLNIYKSLMNIAEDCRIDKLIQRKYPGFKSDYKKSVKYLIEQDYFEIKKRGKPIDDLYLADRINLKYKTKWSYNYALNPKFSSEEKAITTKIDAMETFEEMVEVARLIFDADKNEALTDFHKKMEEQKDNDEENGNGDITDGVNGQEQEGEGKKLKSNVRINVDYNPGDTNESLQDNTRQSKIDVNVGFNIPLENNTGVIDSSKNKLSVIYNEDWYKNSYYDNNAYSNNLKNVRDENKGSVNRFASGFNSRKRAREFSKVGTADKGTINTNLLYKASFDDNIFSKNELLNFQKNHGFIFLVDCSGSMSNIFSTVMKQMVVFSQMCEQIQVPYIVCGFSDSYNPDDGCTTFNSSRVSLQKFIDSRDSRKNNIKRIEKMLNSDIILGSTPLSNSLYLSYNLIENFKLNNTIDILNFVVITDGGDTSYVNNSYIQDKKTGTIVKNELSPRGLGDNVAGTMKLLKKVFNLRTCYFDITSQPNIEVQGKMEEFQSKGFIRMENVSGIDNVIYIKEKEIKNTRFINELVEAFS